MNVKNNQGTDLGEYNQLNYADMLQACFTWVITQLVDSHRDTLKMKELRLACDLHMWITVTYVIYNSIPAHLSAKPWALIWC